MYHATAACQSNDSQISTEVTKALQELLLHGAQVISTICCKRSGIAWPAILNLECKTFKAHLCTLLKPFIQ